MNYVDLRSRVPSTNNDTFDPHYVTSYIKNNTNVDVVAIDIDRSTGVVTYHIDADDRGIDAALRAIAVLHVKNVIPLSVDVRLMIARRDIVKNESIQET